MILNYIFNYEVDNTMEALRQAAEAAWWILGEWGFNEDEKIAALGFPLHENFPDGSIKESHTQHISLVLEINNMLWTHQVDCSIISRPLGIGPFFGENLKSEIFAWGIETVGFHVILEFLQWLYEDGPWPIFLCDGEPF